MRGKINKVHILPILFQSPILVLIGKFLPCENVHPMSSSTSSISVFQMCRYVGHNHLAPPPPNWEDPIVWHWLADRLYKAKNWDLLPDISIFTFRRFLKTDIALLYSNVSIFYRSKTKTFSIYCKKYQSGYFYLSPVQFFFLSITLIDIVCFFFTFNLIS